MAPGGTSNTSSMPTAETVKDGAMTAPEPNHSPISAAGGAARPSRGVGDGAQHSRGAAQVAEPLDPHRVSVTES